MDTLLTSVTDAFGTVLDWVGTFLTSLVSAEGELNALLPLVAISVSVSVLMLGIVRHVHQLKADASEKDRTYRLTCRKAGIDQRHAILCEAR